MKEEFESSGQLRKKKSIRKIFDFFYYGVLKIGRICLKPLRVPWKVLEEKVLMKYFEDSLVAKYKNQNIEICHRIDLQLLNNIKTYNETKYDTKIRFLRRQTFSI